MPPRFVYLRGLNTYGDDSLHIPPMVFGPMWSWLQPHFPEMIAVPAMGSQGPEVMAQRAADFLLKQPAAPMVLFGHSTGGLAARVLAHHPKLEIQKVITIGSPHRGSEIVDGVLRSGRASQFFTKLVGYDFEKRRQALESLSTAAIEKFNRQYPDQKNTHYFSLAGAMSYKDLSWLGQGGARTAGLKNKISDGFFSLESQKWGSFSGQFALDHNEEIGFCVRTTPWGRARFQREFLRLINQVRSLANG